MAPNVHRQEVLLKDLSTRSVTFYPSRALISRELPDVQLKPGANEVVIYGLTPTTDEHSIKVDGTGSGSVTDMTIDLVPNKETFAQAYPDDVDIEDSESDEDDSSDDSDEESTKEVRDCRARLKAVRDELAREQTIRNDLGQRQGFLSNWYQSMVGKDAIDADVEALLKTYREQNLAIADDLKANSDKITALHKKQDKLEKSLRTLTRDDRRAKRKADVEIEKKKQEWRAKKEAEVKEKQRIKDERAKYFPKKVYKVTLHLDVPSDTPGTSRRSSMSSITLAKDSGRYYDDEGPSRPQKVTLQLSYITTSASWAPRYDIDLLTSQRAGKIIYRAEFTNHTSETWKDARLSLSTSQASFRGLDDEVPWMHKWSIGLQKGFGQPQNALFSHEEKSAKSQGTKTISAAAAHNRSDLFGIENSSGLPVFKRKVKKVDLPRGEAMDTLTQAPATYSSHAAPRARSAAFGAPPPPAASAPGGSNALQSHSTYRGHDWGDAEVVQEIEAKMDVSPQVDFEDTTWEDHGLTTTYDVPGTRTIEPSSLTRRHKIASLPISNLVLPSIAVPKLRPAAFLRARFRNPSSSITLLKGTAGLTLDGTFLGNTTLPRVSPGELITLPLGVDPALHITYAKPAVKHSTQGIFTKDSSQVFTRSIIITNTKSTLAELLVLDQVPLSEDEKLRVEIIEPRGLTKEGDIVSTGINASEAAKKEEKRRWGNAKAMLKANGQVAFNVMLEKGAACKLLVEYEAKAPASETIVSK